MVKNLLNSINKQFLRIAQPFTNEYYNRKVQSKRKGLQVNEGTSLDGLIPDERHLHHDNIQKIKHIALRILNCIDHLGKELHFDYFLAYGTLIGAVRHQGFIPWDDDLDIMMTYSDFDQLLNNCHLLPSSLKLFRMSKDFWKLMDEYSIISKDGKRGIAVDIFLVADKRKGKLSFRNVHTRKIESFLFEDVFPLKRVVFEHHQFPIPNNTHSMLERIYGDYMELPPVDKRVFPHLRDELIINEFGEKIDI